jgi:small redox-active disulfide protein 2
MDIKILGSGCPNCDRLESNVKEALFNLKLEATVEKVTDLAKISSFGVMSTPALVVDGTVLFSGRVLSTKKIQNILKG